VAIFVSKSIKVNGNLTKFWRKQCWLFFWDTVYCIVSSKRHRRWRRWL